MAKIMVKCPYCNESFDRNNSEIKWVKIGRRYAHVQCHENYEKNMSQDERDFNSLLKYTQDLFGEDFVYIKIKRQIEQYHNQYGYSYSGMLLTLKYFYEVKGNSKEKALGGIGIIPYIYKEAYNYYYTIYLAQQKNKSVKDYRVPVKEITIEAPKRRVRRPRLWLEEEDEQ